jgi:hypothetical protein
LCAQQRSASTRSTLNTGHHPLPGRHQALGTHLQQLSGPSARPLCAPAAPRSRHNTATQRARTSQNMRQQLAACGSSSSSSSSCWLRPLTPHVPASRPSCSGISSSSSSGCGSAGSARLTPGELAPGRATRATRVAAAGGGGGGERPGSDRPGSSNTGGRPHEPRRSKPERKARKPGLFEVRVMTPPPRRVCVYACVVGGRDTQPAGAGPLQRIHLTAEARCVLHCPPPVPAAGRWACMRCRRSRTTGSTLRLTATATS